MILIDSGAHSEQVQAIRYDIKRGSVERSRDVENRTFSENGHGYTHRVHFSSIAIFFG
jgi:hypothetical protein